MTPGVDPVPDPAAVPAALRDRAQWLCWRTAQRDGKATKLPVAPATGAMASATDPATWTSFDTARDYATTDAATGVGFVFTPEDPFVGIDLDDCRDPETGVAASPADAIIARLDSYTEVSPSGTGYHVLVEGELPGDRNRRGDIELYDRARYFTVTGARVDETPAAIHARTDALAWLYAEYIQSDETGGAGGRDAVATTDVTTTPAQPRLTTGGNDLADDAVVERARAAANGDTFQRLWRGDTSGYPSHSEADMALCCLLAFWTGGDAQQMDRLFRDSGLMREKWDAVHYADGATYGERTIERARRVTSERYDPSDATEDDHGGQAAARPPSAPSGEPAVDVAARDGTALGSEPAPDASEAHLREANAVLRERLREQQARIEALEAERAAGTAAGEGAPHEEAADAQSPSLVQRLRGVLGIRGADSADEP